MSMFTEEERNEMWFSSHPIWSDEGAMNPMALIEDMRFERQLREAEEKRKAKKKKIIKILTLGIVK